MIYQKIQDAIKTAMKEKDINKKDVLKMAMAKAQAIAKDKKSDITDEIMIDGIQRELKQLKQTKDSLVNRQDTDLYKSTIIKIDVLNEYLPKKMSDDEVKISVHNILSSVDQSNLNIGTAMKAVMAQLNGKAENKTISKYVKEYISNK